MRKINFERYWSIFLIDCVNLVHLDQWFPTQLKA